LDEYIISKLHNYSENKDVEEVDIELLVNDSIEMSLRESKARSYLRIKENNSGIVRKIVKNIIK